MNPPPADEVPRRNPNVEWVVLDGHAAIHDAGRYHTLDPSATAIWVRLDGDRTLGEIAADLAEEFDTNAAVISRDVTAFVDDLRSRGLVETPVTEPAPPTWNRAHGTVWRNTARGCIVLADHDEPVLLRGAAVPLWALLDQPLTAEVLASVLAEATGADVGPVAAAVDATLSDLEDRGLVIRT